MAVTPLNSKFQAAKPGFPSFVAKSGRAGGRHTLPEKRSLCASLESVNELLRMDGGDDDQHRTLDGAHDPLDEWRRVPFLHEWRLDGVALGVDTEENLSQILNVAIGGVCRQVVNIFGGRRAPLETLYIGLVARLKPDLKKYYFEYVPFGENLLFSTYFDDRTHPLFKKAHGRDGVTDDVMAIECMVGAWKLGVVTDTASVRDGSSMRELPRKRSDQRYMQLPVGEHNVSAKVVVEWVDWRSLIRQYPDCIVGRDHTKRSSLTVDEIVYHFPHEDIYEPPGDPESGAG